MNPAGILLNDTIRIYSLHFIANSSSSWSLTLCTCSLVSFAAKPRSVRLRVSPYSQEMDKSNDIKSQTKWTLFVERELQYINNSPNLHLFMFSVLPLPKRDHQLDINFSLFQQISAGTFAKKKRRGEKEWPSAATWSRGLNISPELRLVQWYNPMMPWWTNGLAAHRLSISLLNDCVPGVYIFLPKKKTFSKTACLRPRQSPRSSAWGPVHWQYSRSEAGAG